MSGKSVIEFGLPLGCDGCVLPEGYAGAVFLKTETGRRCNFCEFHKEPVFRRGEQLINDLKLNGDEQVGVTVSGGKDSTYVWGWLADVLGSSKVVAFNHWKEGLVHPLAEENLKKAEDILGSGLVYVSDSEMLPRFRRNLRVLLEKTDPAMVRVALCAGCRVGISGKMFEAGRRIGITKFVSAASYLELAPFKAATMRAKGDGNEREGLLRGLQENPSYGWGNNIDVIMLEDEHCHKTQLTGGGAYWLYPGVRFFDFDSYFPNDPDLYARSVKERFGWRAPTDGRDWHFDCLIEPFKDLFYYGTLGYTEMDYRLSAMVRFGLIDRGEAINQLVTARRNVIGSREKMFNLMENLGVGNLISRVNDFYRSSTFLSDVG